jgi:hypothetical protein
VVRNIEAAVHSTTALRAEALAGVGRRGERAEANTGARNLTLGWDWGKWTFDL